MKSASYLFLIFSFLYIPLFSQCEIGELIIDESACLHGEFNVIIDFDHANTSDSFVVRGNGHNYGCFAYSDLPITIDGLAGDCDTEYEFVAIDKEDDDCRNDGILGEVCCVCRIYDIGYDITDCNDHQEFSVELDFLYENTSDSFSISWRGMSQGCFAYADLPITFGPFDGDCTTSYGFLIRDKDDPDCLEDFGIGEVCCEEECEIYDIEVDAVECNGDSCMVVDINFLHNATGSMGFDVFGRNGLIGHFQYNQLPLRIPCFPLSGHQFELVEICDRELPDCCGREEFEALVCDSTCRINDLIVEPFDCDSLGNFFVELDFEYQNVSDSFKLTVNGHSLGTFPYDSLAIAAGPIEGGCDSRNEFIVYDCLDSLCADTVVLEGTCCEEEECRIYEIEYELTECDSNDMFEVVVNFHSEHVSDSFQIEYDGNILGCYAYGDLPVRFGPFEGDCETEYGFIIRDKENGHCLEDFGIGEVCCEEECDLYELEYEVTDCDTNDQFNVIIDFLYAGTSDSFSIMGNGHNYGCFAYADLPVTLGPLEGDCHTSFEFVIRDKEKERCAIDFHIGEVCCEEECRLYELVVEPFECDSNNTFLLEIDFLYENTSDSFDVTVNGHPQGRFAYADLAVIIGRLEGGCDSRHVIEICDSENEDCCVEKVLEGTCCEEEECRIYEIEYELTECDSNDMFEVVVNFDYEHVSDSFQIEYNRSVLGCYAYADLPVRFGPFLGDCHTPYRFVIRDKENGDCLEDFHIGEICCNECDLYELEYEVTECDSLNQFQVIIDFLYVNTSDSFSIMGNGHNYGCFAYADLPVTLGPLEGDCDTNFEFVIRDKEKERCAIDFHIGEVCCEEECRLYELVVEPFECDTNSTFLLEIDFLYEHTSDSFDVTVNGHPQGRFAYADLAVVIGRLEGGCDSRHVIEICDSENRDCCVEKVIEGTCCEEEECRIYEIEYELTECDSNDMFEVVVNFDYEHVSDSFQIEYNRSVLGCYAYADLPVRFGPFLGDCHTPYGFIIRDKENGDCLEDFRIGEVCCNECRLYELVVEPFDCDTNHTFLLEIDFLYENTSDSFDVTVNGHAQGRFAYDSLAIVIGRLEGGCDSRHVIEICDQEHHDCCVEVVIEGTCCDMGCSIGELEVEALECNGDSCLYVKVDFEYSGTGENFNVYDRQGLIGTYSYGLLPLTIDCYPISGFDQEYIRVCDEDQEDCCAVMEFDGLDCTTIGTFDLEDLGWTVNYSFPTSTITLENKGTSASIEMYLFNIEGKQMVQRQYQTTDTFDISHLKSGVYVVAVNVGGYIEHKKIVKL